MEHLLDHLERNPSWKLHGFLRTCIVTGQQQVVSLLGLEPSIYEDKDPTSLNQPDQIRGKSHYYRLEENGEKLEISQDLLNGNV